MDDSHYNKYHHGGTLRGHLVTASLFLLYGTFRFYCILTQYMQCERAAMLEGGKTSRMRRYKNIMLTFYAISPRIPLEPLIGLIGVGSAIIMEFSHAFIDGHFQKLANAQHISMYSFFLLITIISLIESYFGTVFIPNMAYISMVLAFTMQGVLFYYHLHGRAPLDIQLHMFMFYLIMSSTITLVAEMLNTHNISIALIRCGTLILQGTWLTQIGFILYPPWSMETWDMESTSQSMIVTLVYTWHFAAVFIIICVVILLVRRRVWRMHPSDLTRHVDLYEEFRCRDEQITKCHNDYYADDKLRKNLLYDSDDGVC